MTEYYDIEEMEVEDDEGYVTVMTFIGYAHASLIPRQGVAQRGAIHTIITDDPCDCPDDHIELWAVRIMPNDDEFSSP